MHLVSIKTIICLNDDSDKINNNKDESGDRNTRALISVINEVSDNTNIIENYMEQIDSVNTEIHIDQTNPIYRTYILDDHKSSHLILYS